MQIRTIKGTFLTKALALLMISLSVNLLAFADGFKGTPAPTIGALNLPAESTASAPFTLSAPTSNSAGTFTYTSSNTSVATISGNKVTVVGAGSTVITATQAANGGYTTGSVNATLTVSCSPVLYDNNVVYNNAVNTTSLSISKIVVPAGNEKAIILMSNSAQLRVISSITYNGMFFNHFSNALSNGGGRGEIWYLLLGNMAVADSGSIVITYSGSSYYLMASAESFSGVNQTTPLSNINSVNYASTFTSSDITITGHEGDMAIDGIFSFVTTASPSFTATTGQNVLSNNNVAHNTSYSPTYRCFSTGIAPVSNNMAQFSWSVANTYSSPVAIHFGAAIRSNTPILNVAGTTSACDKVILTASGGATYKWSGGNDTIHAADTFNLSGNYTVKAYNTNGCSSSLSNTVVVNKSTTASITHNANNSYTWHSNTYTNSGFYTFDTINKAGCDSLITLNLTITTIPPPVIYSFDPPGACPGKATTVTIFGSGFTGATNVSMVGKYPMFPFTVNSDNSITTTIPANDTGVIFVETPVNIAFAPTSFTNNSSYTPFAYVVNSRTNNVTVVSTVTNAIVATIPVGNSPISTCFSPDGTRVYVTNYGSNNVSVINTATNTVIDSVTVGNSPYGASITPDGKKIYVGNGSSNDVTVINAANNSVIKTIPIGSNYSGPDAVSISPDGSKVYVANYNGPLSVINTATDSISTTTSAGNKGDFWVIKFSPDGKKAFAGDDSVYTINTATNSVINSISIGSWAEYLQPNIDGTKLYVSNYTNSSVTVINTINNTIIKNIPLGNNPSGLSLTPDGSKLYVETSGSNTIYVINTASDSVINTISGFNYPQNMGNFIGNVPVPCCVPTTATITQTATDSYTWHGTTYTNSGVYTFDTLNVGGCDSLTTLNLTITAPTTPVIYSFNPPSACPGNAATVTIFGSGFTGATAVTVGSATISFTVNSDNNITATIPAGDTGKIQITTPIGVGTSANSFNNKNSYIAYAYVPNIKDSVTVINTATNTIVTKVQVGGGPQGVCFSPDGTKVYVSNYDDNTVSVISTANNTVVATIPVGNAPAGISFSPDGTKAYVANNGSDNVSVINTANYAIIASVPGIYSAQSTCISPDGKTLYVSNYEENYVSPINTATNTYLGYDSILIPRNGITTTDGLINISPDGSKIFVTTGDNKNDTVYIFNASTKKLLGAIGVGNTPYDVAITPDGTKAYIANQGSNTVSVLNTTTNAIIKTINVGNGPNNVRVTPDGTTAYVLNGKDNTVSIISTTTDAVLSTIATIVGPYTMGNFIGNVPTVCCVPTTATITQTACGSYLWHGTTYTNSGVYTFDTLNAGGCDSLTTLNLTITAPPTPVIYSYNPPSNCPGKATTVTIFGENFTGATLVSLDGRGTLTPMSLPFTVNSDNSITTTIPANSGGWINVHTPAGYTSAPVFFNSIANAGTGYPTATAYAPYAYVANQQSNNVTVVSTVTNAIVATIPVGKNPISTCFSPDGTRVYVTNSGSNNVSVINTATNTVIDSVTVGNSPYGASITPDGKKIYVGNGSSNDVTVINAANNSVIKTIPVGDYYGDPDAVSISPDGSKVYVANYFGPLSVINTATDSISTTTSAGNYGDFWVVKFSPDGKKAFAGNDSVYTINTATNSVVNSISIGSKAEFLQPNIDGTKLYVSNYTNSSVTVINTINNTIIKNIPLGNNPSGLSLTPDGSKLYVETSDSITIYVINTASDSVINTISGFNYPENMGNFIGNVPVPCCVPTTATITQTATDRYTWHGTTYTTSGTYTFDTLNIGGCDSLTTLNLTLHHSPVIYSFNPPGNCPGKATTVTIFGSGFTGATNVSMVGKYPMFPFTVNSDNSITTTIPANDTGVIFVETPVNIAFAPTSFTNNSNYAPYAYIPDAISDSVTVINTATNAIVTKIKVGNGPGGVCFSPDGTKVYVSNYDDNTVSVISTANNTVVATFQVGQGPGGISFSPDGTKVYVSNYDDNTVSVINTANYAVVASVPNIFNAWSTCISPDGETLYVSNYAQNYVSPINTATNTYLGNDSILFPRNGINTNNTTNGLINISPDGSKIFVTSGYNNNDTVYIFNASTKKQIGAIGVGKTPVDIAITPDGTKAYIANQGSNTVSVLNTTTNAIIKTINVGNSPSNVRVTPDGTTAYVLNWIDNIVNIISTATDSVLSTIAAPGHNTLGNFIGNVPVPCCLPTTATITQTACGSYLWHGTTYTASGTYTFDTLNVGGCDSLTTLNLTINPSIPVVISISSHGNDAVCAGTSVTYYATPSLSPPPFAPVNKSGLAKDALPVSYQWKVNGVNVGTDNDTYTYIPKNGDVISCVLTANNAAICYVGSATSNSIVETVNATMPAVISISSHGNDAVCAGTSVTYYATPDLSTGAPGASYQWKVNGVNVGTDNDTYTYIPKNGDVISCVLTANNAAICYVGTATSNSIVETIKIAITPSLTIASTATTVCSGTGVLLSETNNSGITPTFSLFVNGILVGQSTQTSYPYIPNNRDSVVVMMDVSNQQGICFTSDTVYSNSLIFTVNNIITPSVTISSTAATVCSGTGVLMTENNNTGISPSFSLFINGSFVGQSSQTSYPYLPNNGDSVYVEMILTGNYVNGNHCYSTDTVFSNGIKFKVNPPTTATINHTACDSYFWHGTTYTTSGAYTFDSLNANGCDSLTTLYLTINKSTSGSLTVTSCDSYFWHGTTYTTSGAYTFDSLNVKGCDSLTTLYLTINKSTTGSVTVTSCDSYFWHGTTYTTSGAYTFDSLNANGCDSLTTLYLTINKSTSGSLTVTSCDSYFWHGTTYTTSGAYTFDSLNVKGCDSLTTLYLTINKSTTGSVTVTSCDSYFWHGTTYTTSGAYTFDSLNVKGCDSLTTLYLTINKSTTGSVTVTSCDSYFWHGTTYTTSGAYSFDSLNVKGCDSLTTLYLTINKSTTGSVTVTSCDSYFWHGTTYTKSGAYSFDSLNVKGCDSLTTLNLTIHKSTSATIFQFACDSYTWHGTTYTTSGNYTFDSLNAQGCDSLTTLSLTIDNFKIDSIGINPNFVTAGAPLAVTLYANNPIASATWTPDYLFSGNSAIQSIIVPDNAFRIAVTGYSTNGCIDTASRYIAVKNVDMFIPNAIAPANNDIRVRTLMAYGAAVKSAELSVYNQWGQLLYHSSDAKYPGGTGWDGTYNGKKQPSGVYVYVMKINYYNNKTETKTGSVNLIR